MFLEGGISCSELTRVALRLGSCRPDDPRRDLDLVGGGWDGVTPTFLLMVFPQVALSSPYICSSCTDSVMSNRLMNEINDSP